MNMVLDRGKGGRTLSSQGRELVWEARDMTHNLMPDQKADPCPTPGRGDGGWRGAKGGEYIPRNVRCDRGTLGVVSSQPNLSFWRDRGVHHPAWSTTQGSGAGGGGGYTHLAGEGHSEAVTVVAHLPPIDGRTYLGGGGTVHL